MSVTVYRVSYRDRAGKHQGHEYFLKSIAAESAVHRAQARKWNAEVKPFEVGTSKEGIWKALNELAGIRITADRASGVKDKLFFGL